MRVAGVTALSQAVSAGALGVLQIVGPPWNDVVSFGVQVGGTSLTALVVGILYNLVLGRPDFSSWRLASALAGGASVVVGLGSGVWLAQNGSDVEGAEAFWVIAAFGLGGAGLAIAGVRAVRLACLGSPMALAGVFLAPNAALLAGVVVVAAGLGPANFTTSAAWCVGCGIAAVWCHRLRLPKYSWDVRIAAERDHRIGAHVLALTLGAIVGAVLPLVYLAAMVGLEPGLLSLVYFVGRVGASVVGLGVNSVLLVRFNWSSGGVLRRKPLEVGCWVAAVSLALGWAAGALLGARTLGYVGVALGWVVFISLGAIVGREANAMRRWGPLLAKVVADGLLGAVAATLLFSSPTVVGYFGAFSLAGAVTVVTLGVGRGRPATVILGTVGALFAVLAVASGF